MSFQAVIDCDCAALTVVSRYSEHHIHGLPLLTLRPNEGRLSENTQENIFTARMKLKSAESSKGGNALFFLIFPPLHPRLSSSIQRVDDQQTRG